MICTLTAIICNSSGKVDLALKIEIPFLSEWIQIDL
jgi:hypothetical protein